MCARVQNIHVSARTWVLDVCLHVAGTASGGLGQVMAFDLSAQLMRKHMCWCDACVRCTPFPHADPWVLQGMRESKDHTTLRHQPRSVFVRVCVCSHDPHAHHTARTLYVIGCMRHRQHIRTRTHLSLADHIILLVLCVSPALLQTDMRPVCCHAAQRLLLSPFYILTSSCPLWSFSLHHPGQPHAHMYTHAR